MTYLIQYGSHPDILQNRNLLSTVVRSLPLLRRRDAGPPGGGPSFLLYRWWG